MVGEGGLWSRGHPQGTPGLESVSWSSTQGSLGESGWGQNLRIFSKLLRGFLNQPARNRQQHTDCLSFKTNHSPNTPTHLSLVFEHLAQQMMERFYVT